jgi:hypothetical protein
VSSSERIDIGVSRRVLWVGGQAYPLQSIARAQATKLAPSRGAAWWRYLKGVVLEVFVGVAAAVALKLAPRLSSVRSYNALHGVAVGVLVLVAVLVVVSTIKLIARLSRRTYYALVIETAGTSRSVLVSDDKDLVRKLAARIMAAIVDPQANFRQSVVNYDVSARGSRGALTGGHGLETSKELTHERGTARPAGSSVSLTAGGGGANGGSQARDPAGGGVHQARRRYLMGQCQESVPVGRPFSLLASIILSAGPASAELAPFDVPPQGQDVDLVMYAPGLKLLGDQQQTVHVPADRDSRPVRFELRADAPGPQRISIMAWIGGSLLGELLVEITAERDRPAGPHREVLAEIITDSTEGAVSLVVRYDPRQNAYRFEFRDEDNPDEVTSNLAYEPGPLVEHLVADLDDLTKGRSGYSAAQTRDYLVNAGARLWRDLVPGALREQFWDRQHRIRQLTILADSDVVPWELLYPMDPGHDIDFLVQQFPVTRAIFGWRPARTLRLWPTRFVLPEGSLPEARDEIKAVRRLLDPGQSPSEVISALTPLTDLIGSGNFGLLHFACHNTYDPASSSSIRLGNVQFTPTLMTTAVIQKVLKGSAPTVFINACRSAGSPRPITGSMAGPASSSRLGPPRSSGRSGRYPMGRPANSLRNSTAGSERDLLSGKP